MLVSKRRIWELGKQTPPSCSQDIKFLMPLFASSWNISPGCLLGLHVALALKVLFNQHSDKDATKCFYFPRDNIYIWLLITSNN